MYGGQPAATVPSRDPSNPEPKHFKGAELAELYALALGTSVESKFRDWRGYEIWSDEARRELRRRGTASAPLLHRMLTAEMLRVDGEQIDQDLRVPWKNLSRLSDLPSEYQPGRRWLYDRFIWAPVCEIKKYGGRALRKRGDHDAQAVAILALGSGMIGGCEGDAREALRNIANPSPDAAPQLARLLEHPIQATRQYAAETLARIVGYRLPVNDDGLPTDRAIAALSTWWDAHGRERDAWPSRAKNVSQQHTSRRNRIARFSADGARVAVAGAGPVVRVWRTEGDAPPIALKQGDARWVSEVALSEDGRYVAAFSQDHVLRAWDLEQPDAPIQAWRVDLTPYALALSAEGKTIAFPERSRLTVADVDTGQVRWRSDTTRDWIGDIAFNTDGTRVVADSRRRDRICLYNARTGQRIAQMDGLAEDLLKVRVLDGGRLFTVSYDDTARLWRLDPPRETFRAYDPTVEFATGACSDDGKTLAIGTERGRIQVWRVGDSSPRRVIDVGPKQWQVRDLTFISDHKLRAITADNRLSLWNVRTGERLRQRMLTPTTPRPWLPGIAPQ